MHHATCKMQTLNMERKEGDGGEGGGAVLGYAGKDAKGKSSFYTFN